MTDNEQLFLIGLERLSRETGVKVQGCGCCSSLYLFEFDDDELSSESGYGFSSAGEVCWISKNDLYEWGLHSESIVKSVIN